MRINKGQSIITNEDRYVCIDIETTGFSSQNDEIIELAAVKIENNEVIDSFLTLVNPMCEISSQITKLTGISSDMLIDALVIEDVFPQYIQFIGDSLVVGHNINAFDSNFLYDTAEKLGMNGFSNDFIDTLTMAKKVLPELKSHSLESVSEALGVSYEGAHRALVDCEITYKCYELLKERAADMPNIWVEKTNIDTENPLYRKTCVVAGTVKGYTQADIQNIISELGGICKKSLTADIDYLIMGEAKTDKAQQTLQKAQELGVKVLPADKLEGIVENNDKKSDTFGCCHLFKECSDARKCIHRDPDHSKGCEYRKNLESGRVFYGVNRNI